MAASNAGEQQLFQCQHLLVLQRVITRQGDSSITALGKCDLGQNTARFCVMTVISRLRAMRPCLYDMLGGVAQWMADCWSPELSRRARECGTREVKACEKRVLRGGSFRLPRDEITVTYKPPLLLAAICSSNPSEYHYRIGTYVRCEMSAVPATGVTDVAHPLAQVGGIDFASTGDGPCSALSFLRWFLPEFWQRCCPPSPIHFRQRRLIMPELQRPPQRRPPHRHQLGCRHRLRRSLTAATPRSSLSGPAGARWHGHELYCGRRRAAVGVARRDPPPRRSREAAKNATRRPV